MSIPNEALQKLAQEIETQAVNAQREINIVRSNMANKQRELRLIELTSKELSSLPEDTKIYEGVGKMFVAGQSQSVNQRLGKETLELKSDISNLEKKLHYLETTYKNSRENIEKLLNKQ